MATKTRLTSEDLWRMPADDIRRELVNGQVIEMPPADYPHGRLMGRLYRYLVEHVEKHGLGEVVVGNVGFVLSVPGDPNRVRAPDVAFVSTPRLAGAGHAFFPGAPDLAAEILSPSETLAQIQQKVSDYLAAGSRLVWVIDPEARIATIHKADGSTRTIAETDPLEDEDVLPGFSIPLSILFT